MTIQEAKQIRIADYLQSLGYTPVKRQDSSLWYKSPLREEAEASFKVNTELNQWYDFGIGQGWQYHRIGFGTLPLRQRAVSVGVHRQTDTASAHRHPCTIFFGRQSVSEPMYRHLQFRSYPLLYYYPICRSEE